MRKVSGGSLLQFLLFNIGGVLFFVIGYGVFALLYGLFSVHWVFAKLAADAAGWTANYVVQRYVAFRGESKHHRERTIIVRFSLVSFANLILDYALVGGLKFIGISPFLGLWISSLFFTVVKWLQYKYFVFRIPKNKA